MFSQAFLILGCFIAISKATLDSCQIKSDYLMLLSCEKIPLEANMDRLYQFYKLSCTKSNYYTSLVVFNSMKSPARINALRPATSILDS